MAYDAKVLPVMIASPSDVSEERKIVRDVLAEWNVIHSQERQAVFLPVGWETHSAPELAGRPQQIINERLLKDCDLLVGIFWTRVGSDTGKAISGSIEEIQEHMQAGKPVLLYFSEVPVKPGSGDDDQWSKLMDFKKWAQGQGLYFTFETSGQFKADFSRHLSITLHDNPHLRACVAKPEPEPQIRVETFDSAVRPSILSQDCVTMLQAAVAGDGFVLIREFIGGWDVRAGDQKLEAEGRRGLAKWRGAAQQLLALRLLERRGQDGYYEVTDEGWLTAERAGWPTNGR